MTRNMLIVLNISLIAIVFSGTVYIVTEETHQQHYVAHKSEDSNMASGLIGKSHGYSAPIPEETLESLRTTIAELKQEIKEIKAIVPVARKEGIIQQKTRPLNAEEIEQQKINQEIEEYEKFKKVGSHFNEQQINTNWSLKATRRIETALNDKKTEGLTIDNIECRTSMCKLEINDMDESDISVFNNAFRNQIADAFGAGVIGKDEFGKTVIYLAEGIEDIAEN